MKFPLPICALLLLTTAMAWSEPAEQRAPEITIELQCLKLPQAPALPLIKKLRSALPAERAAAMKEVSALLEKGTAKLIAWPIITTHSGQKAVSEAVEEVRYPSQFTANSTSIYLTDNDGNVTKQPKVTGTDSQPMGSAFDTRNVGVVLEVEPSAFPGEKTVEVAFKAAHILLKSIDKWTIEHELTTEKKTEKVIQEQPRFTRYVSENVITLQSGDHKLAGIFKTAEAEPTIELFILGVEIVERK